MLKVVLYTPFDFSCVFGQTLDPSLFFPFDCISWFPGTACFHLHLVVFLNLLLRACLDIALQPLLILTVYYIDFSGSTTTFQMTTSSLWLGHLVFLLKWRNCLWPVLGWNLDFCCLTNLQLHYLVPLMSSIVYIHTFVFGQ